MTLKRFLISPPFGSRISHPDCTRVMGSFTRHKRPGLVWNVMKSLRKVEGGWVNKIGLRNPGILSNVGNWSYSPVYSIVGLDDGDWEEMFQYIPDWCKVELNLGCPNVHKYGIDEQVLRNYAQTFKTLIVKLPATEMVDEVAEMAVKAGVHYLHCSNTLPSPRGGISGKKLKEWNLPVVERLHRRYPHIPIIAGGGIYNEVDVDDYWQAGATHFSLSTIWFRPWSALALLRYARYADFV